MLYSWMCLTLQKDEIDLPDLPRPLTLEDEDDAELKRAIEMSLQEHQHREKVCISKKKIELLRSLC